MAVLDPLPPDDEHRSDWDDHIAELEGDTAQAMICAVCKWPVDSLDDVAERLITKVVCVRCRARLAGDEHHMDRKLRDAVRAAMGTG